MKYDDIIEQGDKNGNGMIVRFRLPSGLTVFGFATENYYTGEWDLGPTWNYAVMADTPFIVDAGRYGQGKKLLSMMEVAGINPSDLEFVLISHGHEDHDGGLAELVGITGLKVRAHVIYDLLIRKHPDMAPTEAKRAFPAKCWHCFMPESFYAANCLGYHEVLRDLEVERIGNGIQRLGTDIVTCHLPGHSPDSLAVILGEDAVIVGDILLPQITPWPTHLEMYNGIREIVGELYPQPAALFGLKRYILSLKQLRQLGIEHPHMQVFPAHRLYYGGQWNAVDLTRRIDELLEHHIQRCRAILDIVSDGYGEIAGIVQRHFAPSLLRGVGIHMATSEIMSHCELLSEFGDLLEISHHHYEATGTCQFKSWIGASDHDPAFWGESEKTAGG